MLLDDMCVYCLFSLLGAICFYSYFGLLCGFCDWRSVEVMKSCAVDSIGGEIIRLGEIFIEGIGYAFVRRMDIVLEFDGAVWVCVHCSLVFYCILI